MEKRVKIIREKNTHKLEFEINATLAELNGKLHDIKFVEEDHALNLKHFVAVLIYTPEGK